MFDDELEIAKLAKEMNGPSDDEQLDEDLDSQPEDDDQEAGEADESEDGETDSDDEDDGEGDPDESDEEDDDQPAGASDDTVIKWKTASGEEFSAPIAELKSGYMRTQDYTHKTQELAKERAADVEQRQKAYQEVNQYAAEIGQLHNQDAYIAQLQQAVQTTNRNDDPVGYQGLVSDLLLAQQQRQGLASRLAQVQQTRTQEQRQAAIEAQQQAVKALSEGPDALPGFGPELVKKISETSKQYGLTDEELSGITDPKYVRILHDAMKYRELQTKKPVAVKKAKQAPARQVRSVPKSAARVVESFDKSPSIEGMAALFNAASSSRKR